MCSLYYACVGSMKAVKQTGGRPTLPLKRERWQVMLQPNCLEQVKAIAASEQRSVSNMLALLVERGVAAYVEQREAVA